MKLFKPQFIKVVPIALLVFLSLQSIGQEINFTQFASAPLTINPANTGLINSDWRASVNYRNDWNSFDAPFSTGSFSYDMHIFKGKLNGSSLGIGVLGTLSQSGDGNAENLSAGLSVAYHQKIVKDPERPNTLSIGLQTLMRQRNFPVIYNYYYLDNQYIAQLDPILNYNLGILYTGYINAISTLYGGVSLYNFTEPVQVYLGDSYKFKTLISSTLGGPYKINDKFGWYYSGVYHQQDKVYDVIIGSTLSMVMNHKQKKENKSAILYLGIWLRYNDALVPCIGLEWKKARLGFSYDINLSNLTEATQGQGGFELSLIYNGGFGQKGVGTPNRSYPRF